MHMLCTFFLNIIILLCGVLVMSCFSRDGSGMVNLKVDSHLVATGKFKLGSYGQTTWSDFQAAWDNLWFLLWSTNTFWSSYIFHQADILILWSIIVNFQRYCLPSWLNEERTRRKVADHRCVFSKHSTTWFYLSASFPRCPLCVSQPYNLQDSYKRSVSSEPTSHFRAHKFCMNWILVCWLVMDTAWLT